MLVLETLRVVCIFMSSLGIVSSLTVTDDIKSPLYSRYYAKAMLTDRRSDKSTQKGPLFVKIVAMYVGILVIHSQSRLDSFHTVRTSCCVAYS